MGFMLLQYEFQRADREVNLCHRKGIRIDNQLTRATKRIEKMTSVFNKAKTASETKWNRNQSMISQTLSNLSLGIASAATGTDPSAIVASAQGMFAMAMNDIVIADVRLSTLVGIPTISLTGSEDINQVKQAVQTAISAAIGQAQQVVSQLIDNAKELDLAVIEEKENEQLAPLSEKEADIQAEKSLNDVLTDLWTERKEKASGKLPDAIKNSMSGFGLG